MFLEKFKIKFVAMVFPCQTKRKKSQQKVNGMTPSSISARAAPFYVGWSGSGGGGCSNASNAPYAVSDDFKIYNT